jgi:hypothetical protein
VEVTDLNREKLKQAAAFQCILQVDHYFKFYNIGKMPVKEVQDLALQVDILAKEIKKS